LYGGGFHLFVNCKRYQGGGENDKALEKVGHVKLERFIHAKLPLAKKLREFNG